MILVNAIATIIAGTLAIFAALFFVASGLARGSTDRTERRHAIQTALFALGVFAVCVLALISLTGCAETRALYDACKDHLCR